MTYPVATVYSTTVDVAFDIIMHYFFAAHNALCYFVSHNGMRVNTCCHTWAQVHRYTERNQKTLTVMSSNTAKVNQTHLNINMWNEKEKRKVLKLEDK